MDYDEACKESCASEKLEIGKRREKYKASYVPLLEEGEFRRDEPFVSESCDITLSSSAQVAVKMDQVNTWQSTSPGRGGTANATVEQSSKYRRLEGHSINVTQPTFRRIYSEKHRRSYSPSFHSSSKERHKQRLCNCFGHYDYHHVLEKNEKVCSERLSKLLLQQNGDRKEFNILQKKQELEFFREHVRSYKVHYERVMPTIRYHRMKLPKLFFCILREIVRKHIQSQNLSFVKRQINDRNKEKRIKERWIFEASAGYLKKCFYKTSLTYSGHGMEKSKWHVHDLSKGEQQLKHFDMGSLTTVIEAIASSSELSHTSKESDVFEPIPENLQSPLAANGGAKHGLSVDVADEIVTIHSMPSQSNYAPEMEPSENVVMQVVSSSPLQNEWANVERPCSSEEVTDEALELAKEVASDSANILPVFREKQRHTSFGYHASEGSCSRFQRKFPHEFASNFHKTTSHHEEPRAARPPTVDDAGRKEVSSGGTSFSAQVTEQRNINANSSALTQSSTLQHCDPTCQNAAPPYQPFGGNTCSVRAGLDSPGAPNVEQQSASHLLTSSMVEQYMPEIGLHSDSRLLVSCHDHTSSFAQVNEQRNIDACSSSLTQRVTQQQYCAQSCQTVVQRQLANQTSTDSSSEQHSGLQSDPFTIELSRLLMLRDLMTKRHLSERQKINLEYEMAVAETKRKYDELFHHLEMETLQKKKDIQVLQDKVCKQLILAEGLQFIHKASVGSCSQRGALQRAMGEPNRSSGQQVLWFPAPGTMYQSPQPAPQSWTNDFIRQPSMTTQEATMNYSLTHAPSGVLGTGISYHAPHLLAFVNQLPATQRGAASMES